VEPLELTVEKHNGATVVLASGEIDMATAPELGACMSGLTGEVVVDLERVTFLDSRGIAALVVAHSQLTDGGGSLTLRRPNDVLRRTLEIVGLREWIEE
jgi:anti-sigma B factor antagonist